MESAATTWTPWLALAGLGAFHGLNPAMGWLFAVGLGLHRRSGTVVLASLVPIALGHALSVTIFLAAVLFAGLILDQDLLSRSAGLALIGWAGWHAAYGHRRKVRIGMQTGLVGLGVWSFVMASAHGAGLMLLPVVLPLCPAPGTIADLSAPGSASVSLTAVAVHTGTMLAVIGVVAGTVYRCTGLAFLRRGWINLDLVWSTALVGTGLFLLLA
jgi:hypothetical protein